MGVVGGSRHYDGGLGAIGGWTCPSCEAENGGPLEQGCQRCGAGKPGTRAAEAEDRTPPPPAAGAQSQPGIDPALAWESDNPDALLRDAWRAGFTAGLRAAMTERPARPSAPTVYSPAGKTLRTMVAALAFFRDSVLVHAPEEVASGEWGSSDEVTHLIGHLAQQLVAVQAEEQQREKERPRA